MVNMKKQFQPIRSLIRGLEIIKVINNLGSVSISEVSSQTGIPRGTVHRMLETLLLENYLIKDLNDNKYRLFKNISLLNDNFKESDWVFSIAKPLIEKLCKKVVWPISIATCNGKEMILRETTDNNSPLALKKISGGFKVPILGSAAGRVFLSYTSDINRLKILKNIENDKTYKSNLLSKDEEVINSIINDVKSKGYSDFARSDLKQSVFAVPINTSKGIIGTIALRYIYTAIKAHDIEAKFYKSICDTASKIASSYEITLNTK